MIDKDIKKIDLIEIIDISSSTLAKLSSNKYVSLNVIDKLCAAFDCQPGDIIEYIPD